MNAKWYNKIIKREANLYIFVCTNPASHIPKCFFRVCVCVCVFDSESQADNTQRHDQHHPILFVCGE